MSWEEIIKGKKLPYTQRSLRDLDRLKERKEQKVHTGMKGADRDWETIITSF